MPHVPHKLTLLSLSGAFALFLIAAAASLSPVYYPGSTPIAEAQSCNPSALPACAFAPQAGRTIVDFGNYNGVPASAGNPAVTNKVCVRYTVEDWKCPPSISSNISLAPGSYTMRVHTADSYTNRNTVPASSQLYEQVIPSLYNASNAVVYSSTERTADLADGVCTAESTTKTYPVTITSAATRLQFNHPVGNIDGTDPEQNSSYNPLHSSSVAVRCVAFDSTTAAPAPTVSLVANFTPPPATANTTYDGNPVRLSWTSANVVSCTADCTGPSCSGSPTVFDNNASKATSGSEWVLPTGNSTYTLTCTAPDGRTANSTAVVNVVTPPASCTTPSLPACTFTPQAGRTIIDFGGDNDIGLLSATNPTLNYLCSRYSKEPWKCPVSQERNISLPAGNYTLRLQTADAMRWRKEATAYGQRFEQIKPKLYNASTVIYSSNTATPDLPDNTCSETTTTDYNVSISTNATKLYVEHAAMDNDRDEGSNNIAIRCAAFDQVVAPPPSGPAAGVVLTPANATITSGNSQTLTWSTTDANSCTATCTGAGCGFTGNKATNGSQNVSPTANATYTLSCTGDNGSGSDTSNITVTPAAACTPHVCNNGTCETSGGENASNCAQDCPSSGPQCRWYDCGNQTCEASNGETVANCPADCGGVCVPALDCGDSVCSPGETAAACPADCGTAPTSVTNSGSSVDSNEF